MITSLNRSKKSKRSTGQESENCQIHGAAGHGHSEGPNDWSPRTEFPHQITPTGFLLANGSAIHRVKKNHSLHKCELYESSSEYGEGGGRKGRREGGRREVIYMGMIHVSIKMPLLPQGLIL